MASSNIVPTVAAAHGSDGDKIGTDAARTFIHAHNPIILVFFWRISARAGEQTLAHHFCFCERHY